jgi:UPF0271 protein
LVTSANVACGYHAGDAVLMRRTVVEAHKLGVAVGAHPGYPDPTGFGRRDMAASPKEVTAYVIAQIGALDAMCRATGTRMRYVKAHGALYNRAVKDAAIADAIAEGIRLVDMSLVMLGLPGTELIHAAERAGLRAATAAIVPMARSCLAPSRTRSSPTPRQRPTRRSALPGTSIRFACTAIRRVPCSWCAR